jgi:hypothetical protein
MICRNDRERERERERREERGEREREGRGPSGAAVKRVHKRKFSCNSDTLQHFLCDVGAIEVLQWRRAPTQLFKQKAKNNPTPPPPHPPKTKHLVFFLNVLSPTHFTSIG